VNRHSYLTMQSLLEEFIRLVIEGQSARVPNQLISPEEASTEDSGSEDEWDVGQENSVEEFSGAGAIAGFTLPLGMSPGDVNVGSRRNKKKRKS
jgi:hypothetical protein